MDHHDLRWTMIELGFLGFSEAHRDEIARKMENDTDKFNISGKRDFPGMKGKESVDYTIYFKKYDRIDAYHPYMYHAAVPQLERSQSFRMVQDAGFSLPDAFNLLHGRAVHKLVIDHHERRLKPYWFQLDLSTKDVHGNHPVIKHSWSGQELSIGKELEARGVNEMLNPTTRVNLILSLYHGNAEPVTIHSGDQNLRVFAVVSPGERSVKLFNRDGSELTKAIQRKRESKSSEPMEHHSVARRRKSRGV